MKKKLFSLALALALCWGLTVPVFASNLKESYETFHIMVPYYTVKKGTTDFAGVVYSSYWGLKDKSGNTVIEPVYANLTLSDNALIATKKVGSYYADGIIDIYENVLLQFQYSRIRQIRGTEYFEVDDSKTFLRGIVNSEYTMVVPPQYSKVGILSEQDGYFCVSDTHNSEVSEESRCFEGIGSTGLKWGVCDRSGKLIIPCKYKDLRYLGDNMFAVQDDTGYCGVLNAHNNQVLPFSYEYIAGYAQGAFIVVEFTSQEIKENYRKYGGIPWQGDEHFLCGLVNIHGDILFPMIYDRIILNADGTGKVGTWNGQYTQSAAFGGSSAPQWKSLDYEPFDIKTLVPIPSGLSNTFTDVRPTDYFADAVLWAVEKNITSGTSKTTFSPDATCSKVQILTFLWHANGSPEPTAANTFTDITPADYFYKAALWAAEKGLVSGSTFGANTDCTRAMTVEYMWKAAGSPAPAGKADFDDVPANADYAQAVAWAVEKNITSGTGDGTFSPAATCTRGQIVTFLYRAMGK